MAEALLQELRPYLVEARTTGQDVTFGNYSCHMLWIPPMHPPWPVVSHCKSQQHG